jgi:hypothetical protein
MQSPIPPARKCLARTKNGTLCQSSGMTNGRSRQHGGLSTGAPKGNKNAMKHGRYSAASISERYHMATLFAGRTFAHVKSRQALD